MTQYVGRTLTLSSDSGTQLRIEGRHRAGARGSGHELGGHRAKAIRLELVSLVHLPLFNNLIVCRSQAAALPLVWLTARTTIEAVAPFVTSTKKIVVLGGSSSVGMYAVHMAKARGWHVVATCSGRNVDCELSQM